nr:hypothetical protein [Gramella sp. MAR_2010_147]
MATLFKLIALWSSKITWDHGGRLLLLLGVFGIWISIYTGDLADGIVARQLCDPTILKEHENLAYTTAWIFTISLLLEILMRYIDIIKTRMISIILVLLMLGGTGTLMYVGHLGAELVYQQAAGVNIPSADCMEFN